jgi:hypothetical protein
MVETTNFGYLYIHAWEWLALPTYLLVIFALAYFYKRKKEKEHPIYRFYLWGLAAKIAGGIFFALIYLYYYKGGDTFSYYECSLAMKNLLFESPGGWLRNEFGGGNATNLSLFSAGTGYPLLYMYYDPQTFTVVKVVNLLLLPSFDSYLLGTVIMSWVCYFGIWRMFLVFTSHYKGIERGLAIAILFFPSVIFWGSGILKDSITLSCTGWVLYCIHAIFIARKKTIRYIFILAFNLFLILLIKPYIIFALLPGSLMWIFSRRIYAIKNMAAKMLIVPVIIFGCIVGGFFILNSLQSYMGKFALEKVTTTAVVTQNDLKQAYYQGHAFDIQLQDKSATGFIKKSPQAFVAGIYRPFLWESDNIVMLLSALENTFILFFSLFILIRVGLFTLMQRLLKEPLLFFTLTYSIFFAFAVGLTTANFGALVRFKIAYLPFFIACLFIFFKGEVRETAEIA